MFFHFTNFLKVFSFFFYNKILLDEFEFELKTLAMAKRNIYRQDRYEICVK